MGRTERKLKKKTRLERLDVYINRLSQFNTNAMHEVGKLAAALRYYADGSVWEGILVGAEEGTTQGRQVTVWKPKEEPTAVARSVLNSLGLPWDKFPKSKDGTPVDPQQSGAQSVLKSIGENLKAEKEDVPEDTRGRAVSEMLSKEDESEYGRYKEGGGVESPSVEKRGLLTVKPGIPPDDGEPLDVPSTEPRSAHPSATAPRTKAECDDWGREKYDTWVKAAQKKDDGIPPEEK